MLRDKAANRGGGNSGRLWAFAFWTVGVFHCLGIWTRCRKATSPTPGEGKIFAAPSDLIGTLATAGHVGIRTVAPSEHAPPPSEAEVPLFPACGAERTPGIPGVALSTLCFQPSSLLPPRRPAGGAKCLRRCVGELPGGGAAGVCSDLVGRRFIIAYEHARPMPPQNRVMTALVAVEASIVSAGPPPRRCPVTRHCTPPLCLRSLPPWPPRGTAATWR